MTTVVSHWANRRRKKYLVYTICWFSVAVLLLSEWVTILVLFPDLGWSSYSSSKDKSLKQGLQMRFAMLLVLWLTLMVGNICFIYFSRASNRPQRRNIVFVLFSLLGIIILATELSLTPFTAFPQEKNKAHSKRIYLPPFTLAIDILLKAGVISLEAWWLPESLRVPFHHEPTINTRETGRWKRGKTNTIGPIRPLSEQSCQGPLEEMFAKHAIMRCSALPNSQEQSAKVQSSSSHHNDCNGPRFHASIRYWYGHPSRISMGYFLVVCLYYPFAVWAAMELIVFGVRLHLHERQSWFTVMELSFPMLVLANSVVGIILVAYRAPLDIRLMRHLRIEGLLFITIASTLTLGLVANWTAMGVWIKNGQAFKHWEFWPRYCFIFPFSFMLIPVVSWAIQYAKSRIILLRQS